MPLQSTMSPENNGTPNRPRQMARRGGTPRRGKAPRSPHGAGGSTPDIAPADAEQPEPAFNRRGETLAGREDDIVSGRLPRPLIAPNGPPLVVDGSIGGMMIGLQAGDDPRLWQMSMGIPVSVHPLRIPNTRACWSSASSVSVIDFKFVRMAGLLHKMVPLRKGVDDVKLRPAMGGNPMNVWGHVDVLFDAGGYEFKMHCWVIDVGFPVEMVLGMDWLKGYELGISFSHTSPPIVGANAKKVRDIQDVYVTE